MNLNESNRNGSQGSPVYDESHQPELTEASPTVSSDTEFKGESGNTPVGRFATRADAKCVDGIDKSKLLLLGGGLTIAVLFFVFTAVIGRSGKKQMATKPPAQQEKQNASKPPKGSVTPLMETVRTPAPDNAGEQLGPGDIKRTRSTDAAPVTGRNTAPAQKPVLSKPVPTGSLGSVPSFADTQQKWEEPRPYGTASTEPATPPQMQNTMKEPSLIFVRSQVQNQAAPATKANTSSDAFAPQLDITPGTRIQAKLETQISSALQAPVVAVVEYTYAIGDRIVVPAGARVYGQLQQADRSGLVSVKFNEIELLDGARESIDAIGTGLDLGPIKGSVSGLNTGKNFLVRTASGISSVAAMLVGNNSSASFSEDDLLRERVAQNIGTAGDSEVMSMAVNSRVVVSVPADTKIYIVFTKHEQSSSELHKVASATP
jgi:hypothetical protein